MIAPEASAAFVANMEDVLDVYQRPRDPLRPDARRVMITNTNAMASPICS